MVDFKKYLNVYEFQTELPGSGKEIRFKPITTGQLKKLLSFENTDDPAVVERALDELISSSIVTEGFNIEDLYLQDRFFILLEIRKKTKGEKYQFTFTCPECKSQSISAIDLSTLEVKKLDLSKIEEVLKLDDNIALRMGFVTRKMEKEAFELAKRLMGAKKGDNLRQAEAAIYIQALSIKSVITPEGEDTNISLQDKKFLLEEIPQGLYQKVLEWYDKNNFGVDFKTSISCLSCDYKKEINIPVEDFFF